MDMFRLDGKVAIVTGGTGLYGKPISSALAGAGAMVIIASRDGARCEAYAEELKRTGGMAVGVALDLGSEASIVEFTAMVSREFGRVDVLVNNAVSRGGSSGLEDMSKGSWERAQEVNSTGMVLLTREVVKLMCAQRSGSIINIGSIQGAVGPNFPVYGDTGMTSPLNYTYDKWALMGFTKWVANYYGKFNIRSNCISPGGYGPGIREDYGENEFVRTYLRLTPLGRFAEEKDIKGPVVFLASDASGYVTGHQLMVDGGWTSW
jgi:NAD(P)-dependent dehydrogenase (short-subunit alcohol dehydrogenase family)